VKVTIKKNQNNSTRYDQQIKDIEGVYPSRHDAINAFRHIFADNYQYVVLPDGAVWMYDPEDKEDIMTDLAGLHALAIIEAVD
jgi:hypothetical protein